MTAAGALLAEEIRRDGPIRFSRFMEVSLYHPEAGYYAQAWRPALHRRDPFGAGGDFFTAEQIQPVFGILMAARVRQLFVEMGEPAEFMVVELGAGREEMAEAFAEWRYVAVDLDRGDMPARFRGVVFCNEFFDALPVDVAVYQGGQYLEQRVGFDGGRFHWQTGAAVSEEVATYFRQYWAVPEEGRWYEAGLKALSWLTRIGAALEQGYLLTIDYGFTRAESVRFPAGTLMGYRRHTAYEDVLVDPGGRDITAHVNFTALEEAGAVRGLRTERFETLAKNLLTAGEADQFRAAMGDGGPAEELRRRMQLKTLLFGMGETFRVLLQRREREEENRREKS
jgi:SAM-dependent MidA family methyltransferase